MSFLISAAKRSAVCMLSISIILCLGRVARAESPSAAPSTLSPTALSVAKGTRLEPARTWYGWQTLTVDVLSITALGTSIYFGSRPDQGPAMGLAVTGLAGAILGAPIIHWVHGNGANGFGSLALRLAGAGIGLSATPGGGGPPGIAYLGLIAFAGASALDAAVFGYELRPSPTTGGWSVGPMLGQYNGIACGKTF